MGLDDLLKNYHGVHTSYMQASRTKPLFKRILIDNDNSRIYYLGYRLPLTKSEFNILKAILQSSSKAVSQEEIASLCEFRCNPDSIKFHIHNINKKAFSVGKRVLISNKTKIGYFLNKEM